MWQIVNDLDLEAVKNKTSSERIPWVEHGGITPANGPKIPFLDDPVSFAESLPTNKPRVIKSHLTFEMLPPKLLDTCKVVYVCRNPKDAIVSYFKMHEMITPEMGDSPFGDYADLAKEGKTLFGSYWEHLKSGWARRDHSNMKFIWFEDLKRDNRGKIKEIGQFLGHELKEEQLDTLCHSTNIDTMRSTKKNLGTNEKDKEYAEKFFRKGEIGNWSEYFHGKRLEDFNKWIDDNLRGIDITLPEN